MKFIQKIFIIVALLCVTVLIVYFFAVNTTKSEIYNGSVVSVQEVNKAMDIKEKVTIVDVRRPEEYKEGHLKNSILLTLDKIDAKALQTLHDKDQLLYVYCRTGKRSAQAAAQLQQIGYTNVHSMDGGIVAWQNSGFPIEK